MGADRERRSGRRRPVRVGAYVGCGALLLAGCASMPDRGDLRDVESTPRADSQVRVFAVPPREDAQPAEIVRGFLEALTSDDPQYETAFKYLAATARKTWDPYRSTAVLADGPNTELVHSASREGDEDGFLYQLSGRKVATVDAQHAYAPDSGSYTASVHLIQQKDKQWRIDGLPPGVVMGKSDFERNYESVNKYYFASDVSSGTDGQGGLLRTVADPVYVRGEVDPMTEMVRTLLEGPTSWLDPVVTSSFPSGTELKKGVKSLSPDDRNWVTVPLNSKADRVGEAQCNKMAAQLLFTLQDLTPTGVEEVELQKSDGSQLCAVDADGAETVASHGTGQAPVYQYFIDAKQRLVRMPSGNGDKDPEPVPGALGEGDTKLRAAAVSRDEDIAAGVSTDGSSLYVGSLVSGSSLGEAVLHSEGKTADDRLTTPSWDGRGDLWVADRDTKKPRLLLLEKGAGEPLVVSAPGLDGRIDAVRVAADGVRIALIVEKDGKSSLQIGRIERDTKSGERPVVSILELRAAAPQLEEVTAMSWAGDSRLVVVGREEGGVQQMGYVQVDGSTPVGTAPSALTGVKEIAASEDERLPLVAHSEEDGIVRLSSGEQWQKVVKDGTAPVYPG
ncbi:LpqB family beta-propeller domain-containing protein [Streptomyces sp. NBC_00038]|uniref:LpqB family beta-propeller domain-containing protein n=1 Tax=Streptomyces sp. NBC_00038 TaxID=2903615 RepID=UPI0022506E03|nr:LpqB family beta-propeller domain-containing protein [Streptomyces sp. NBC_00038]MCX5558163.1 LpqB family beta-propeller domain-containing protein [Streptomyces sp. NBC_00038]